MQAITWTEPKLNTVILKSTIPFRWAGVINWQNYWPNGRGGRKWRSATEKLLRMQKAHSGSHSGHTGWDGGKRPARFYLWSGADVTDINGENQERQYRCESGLPGFAATTIDMPEKCLPTAWKNRWWRAININILRKQPNISIHKVKSPAKFTERYWDMPDQFV